MTITEFLLARIEEDEQAADQEDVDYAHTTLLPTYDSDHQARWHTDRVRAECAAKRAIVAAWTIAEDGAGNYPTLDAGYAEGLAAAVHHLAAIYADHPDYNPAWRVK